MDGKIKNFEQIATIKERISALSIIEAGLAAIDTKSVLKNAISIKDEKLCVNDFVCSLNLPRRVFVVAVGKCAVDGINAIGEILGEKIFAGIALDVRLPEAQRVEKVIYHHTQNATAVRSWMNGLKQAREARTGECHTSKGVVVYYQGTHPFPSEKNIEATREIVKLLKSAEADDLVIVIVSGGGSTLLCLPKEDASHNEEEKNYSNSF